MKGHVLRRAAGDNYLIKYGEEPYRKPLLLNDSAAEIFRRFDGGEDVGSIAAYLSNTYNLDIKEARADVEAVVSQTTNYLGE